MEIITIITRINVLEILVKMKRHGFMASSFKMSCQHFVCDVIEETNFEFRAQLHQNFQRTVISINSALTNRNSSIYKIFTRLTVL